MSNLTFGLCWEPSLRAYDYFVAVCVCLLQSTAATVDHSRAYQQQSLHGALAIIPHPVNAIHVGGSTMY